MLKSILKFFVLALISSSALAFNPQAGGWLVDEENNGLPGRGFTIDVQDDILGMVMFAYQADGLPIFYVAAGQLTANRFSSALTPYTAGRFFGSSDRTAIAGTPIGTVSMRFTSGSTGFVTFPGEREKAMSRFSFGYDKSANSLKGLWLFSSIAVNASVASEVFNLSVVGAAGADGNGVVSNADGTFGCEYKTSGVAKDEVVCALINTSGALLKSYRFKYSVNDGDGSSSVNGSGVDNRLVVRRLLSTKGVETGLVFKPNAAPSILNQSTLEFYIRRATLQ